MGGFKTILIEIIAPALLIIWAASFVMGAFSGETGYGALRRLEGVHEQKMAELAVLSARREALERRANMLNPSRLDPDLVDERIRATLGYVHEDDVVLPRHELEQMLRSR